MIERLDTVFSQYIRLRYADHAGYVLCFTCPVRLKWSEMECSHFIGRSNLAVRFDEENCQVACHSCNSIYGGKLDVFEEELREILGEGGFDALIERSRRPYLTDEELKEKLIHYTRLVGEMGKVV